MGLLTASDWIAAQGRSGGRGFLLTPVFRDNRDQQIFRDQQQS
jgi:hypothetical protein